MVPGEYLFDGDAIELNAGRRTCTLQVNNTGDRPIQIGSHYHFFEVNRALVFDREAAYGMRLDLPAGTAVRIEPGEIKSVRLVDMSGNRQVYGGSALVNGALDDPATRQRSLERMRQAGFGNLVEHIANPSHPRGRIANPTHPVGRIANPSDPTSGGPKP